MLIPCYPKPKYTTDSANIDPTVINIDSTVINIDLTVINIDPTVIGPNPKNFKKN